ncbi:unnamed protein product [Brassica oleracea var. botrytis]|uniref:(rape) hypothetical protein n=1 Tax=Brassica napus TaxID=3708 RepID=A0A816JR36_BRANA|nr:unnamed protein product [Brassica napus]
MDERTTSRRVGRHISWWSQSTARNSNHRRLAREDLEPPQLSMASSSMTMLSSESNYHSFTELESLQLY